MVSTKVTLCISAREHSHRSDSQTVSLENRSILRIFKAALNPQMSMFVMGSSPGSRAQSRAQSREMLLWTGLAAGLSEGFLRGSLAVFFWGVVFISEDSSLIFPETQTGRDETLPCSLLPPFLTH